MTGNYTRDNTEVVQTISGTVTQVIPYGDLDRYIIPRETREGINSDEDIITVQTTDPNPRLRQAFRTLPGKIVGGILAMIPPVRRVLDDMTGDAERVAVPAGEFCEGDHARLFVEDRSFRVIGDECRVHLYAARRGNEHEPEEPELRALEKELADVDTEEFEAVLEKFEDHERSEENREFQRQLQEKFE